jgi:hypothetical protein
VPTYIADDSEFDWSFQENNRFDRLGNRSGGMSQGGYLVGEPPFVGHGSGNPTSFVCHIGEHELGADLAISKGGNLAKQTPGCKYHHASFSTWY